MFIRKLRRINFHHRGLSKNSRNSEKTVFNDESPNTKKKNAKIVQKSAQIKKFDSIFYSIQIN